MQVTHGEAVKRTLEALDARCLTYDTLNQQTRDSQAVAEGRNLFTLLSAIREHEDHRTRLWAELAMLDTLTLGPYDPMAVEQELHRYLTDWPSLAQAHPAQTRQIPSRLLPSRIRVWREVRGSEKVYHFEGEAAVGARSLRHFGLVYLGWHSEPAPAARLLVFSFPPCGFWHLRSPFVKNSGHVQDKRTSEGCVDS